MKILLFGKSGQVGQELLCALADLGPLVSLDRSGQDGFCGDLTNLAGISKTIKSIKPDVIVNAGAYTAVDNAESEPDLVELINAKAPTAIAIEAEKINALFVHYSTDYVFNGQKKRAWKEEDIPKPLNAYGRSKLYGEQGIISSGCDYLIFRTSWVYGHAGHNFIKAIMQLAMKKEQISVINDQVGAPTSAQLLAKCTATAISELIKYPQKKSLYHLAAAGSASWYDVANFIVNEMRQKGEKLTLKTIDAVTTEQYQTIAKRPRNSKLNTSKFTNAFGVMLPYWQQDVKKFIDDMVRI